MSGVRVVPDMEHLSLVGIKKSGDAPAAFQRFQRNSVYTVGIAVRRCRVREAKGCRKLVRFLGDQHNTWYLLL